MLCRQNSSSSPTRQTRQLKGNWFSHLALFHGVIENIWSFTINEMIS